MKAEEFLKKWRKENNTEEAVYSSYHIDAIEAYHKEKIDGIVIQIKSKQDEYKYGSDAYNILRYFEDKVKQ